VVSPSLTFRTDVQLVQMPAKQASGRVSSSANQMSPPSALLNSLNELNGTTQRFSGPSHRVQCLLFTLRMLAMPPSGSIRSNSLNSTVLRLASSFTAKPGQIESSIDLPHQMIFRNRVAKTKLVEQLTLV